MKDVFDLAVVGAGILGLAHALAAARRGKRVLVLDADAQANGASIRNFGFVTVTGQQAGECWSRARRSRDVWAEVAPKAGIDVVHRGLLYWPNGRRRSPSWRPSWRRTWARTAVC
jgi:glycine/D-amino acid oxidase-like deaminating enzyme